MENKKIKIIIKKNKLIEWKLNFNKIIKNKTN